MSDFDAHIEVIAVSYRRFGELKVFVQSWLNQTVSNWSLRVIHDGPSEEFEEIMRGYELERPNRISHACSYIRYNDYGHSLRELGLKSPRGDYVLLTNADNYFVPKAAEFLSEACRSRPDVVLFDMVHSHNTPGGRSLPSYSYFQTEYRPGSIDVSSALVRSELAAKVGFRDKGHDGDATYFMDILQVVSPEPLNITKINRVLFVHN